MTAAVTSISPRGKIFFASAFLLAIVVCLMYQPALGLNFYGDDYSFVEKAGRSSLGEYLTFYFDPRAQTGWYRPIQGLLFGIEWLWFDGNPRGYHAVNVLVHFFNSIIFFAIVARVVQRLRIASVAALIWCGLPLYAVSVFWPGDADFLLTFFYLLAILFWILFLQQKKQRWKIFSFVMFLLALITKEFGVTVPLILFLLDRFVVPGSAPTHPRVLLARYAHFLFVFAIYLPLELYIQSRGILTNEYGYGVGAHLFQNFIGYLAIVAFPWLVSDPFNYIWLGIAAISLLSLSFYQKSMVPVILALIAIIAFFPVVPFPWFFQRYLYSAVMISAILPALLVDFALERFPARWLSLLAAAAVATIVLGNGLGVAFAASDFAEIGRQTRVPFRDFTQRHSSLPVDTLIYFVDPPTIPSQLSGMFFLRYGAGVRVASDDQATRADLRGHQAAYLIYFDREKRTREIAIEKNLLTKANNQVPLNFGSAILKDWELASDHAKPGQAVALILYWEAPVKANVRLVDAATGQVIADSSGRPRRPVADVHVLDIPPEARPGNYHIEITVSGAPQKLVIEPITVTE